VSQRRRNPLLSNRDGRLFVAAQSGSVIAAGIANVALPWLVLDAGGSPGLAGLVFTVGVLPYLLFGLPSGLIGDRFPRKLVMAVGNAFQAAVAVVIPVWALVDAPPLPAILAAAFLIGVGRVLSDGASFGAVAAIAGREHLGHAQATLTATWAIGQLAGPTVGGTLIGAVGAAQTLWLQTVAFLVAAVLVLVLRTDLDTGRAEPEPPLQALKEGLRTIVRDPIIRTYSWMTGSLNLIGVGAGSLMVPLLKDEVGLSAGKAGAVLATGAVAGLAAPWIVPRLIDRFGGLRVSLACMVWSGTTVAVLSFADSFGSALAVYWLMSLAMYVSGATMIGERQRRAPLHLQGRVGITGRMIFMTTMAIGSAIAAGLAELVGLRPLYLGMGLATLAFALVTGRHLLTMNRIAMRPVPNEMAAPTTVG